MNTKNQSLKHVVTNLIKILKEQIALNGNILCQHQDLERISNLGQIATQNVLKMEKSLKAENVLVKLVKNLD